VVLINYGPRAGKLAVIVDIIDHNRAIIDGEVPRHAESFKRMTLTNLVIPKLPRDCSTKIVQKKWKAAQISEKWAKSAWAKSIETRNKRANLTDFDRFKIMLAKKQVSFFFLLFFFLFWEITNGLFSFLFSNRY